MTLSFSFLQAVDIFDGLAAIEKDWHDYSSSLKVGFYS